MVACPKPKAYRSEPYLAFIREHPCLRCGKPSNGLPKPCNNIIAHHEGLGANRMGGKPPDSHCLPLCGRCHHLLNAPGITPREVWEKIYIEPKLEIIKLLTEYLSQGKD